MKKQITTLGMLAAIALFTAACSKDSTDKPDNGSLTEGLVFSMSEAPYNDEVNMDTRAQGAPLLKDTLTFNGVEAEVTLERDTKPQQPETRAITNGNKYTIVVFKAGTTQPVAETKGHFDTTGKFVYETGHEMMRIPAGSYDFACYTHDFATRSGNTISIPLENADKAFICRQTGVTITNVKRQEVAFVMKHAGARVRTRVLSAVGGIDNQSGDIIFRPENFTGLLGYRAGEIPEAAIYDLSTGAMTGSTNKSATSKMETQNYDIADGREHNTTIDYDLLAFTGNKYLTIPGGTKPEELVYQITGGTAYKRTVSMTTPRKLKATGAFDPNGAYTLNIRLLPRYQYLFEDGVVGYLKQAGRENHVPIALVCAPHTAIALWDAATTALWASYSVAYIQNNSVQVLDTTTPTTGKTLTWESYNSLGTGVNVVKPDRPAEFPAFNAAGYFYNNPNLTNKLNGKTLNANLRKPGVWYLGSLYEWACLVANIGFTDQNELSTLMPIEISCETKLIDYAFKVAKGVPATNRHYWSCDEDIVYYYGYFTTISSDTQTVQIYGGSKAYSPGLGVRPFISF